MEKQTEKIIKILDQNNIKWSYFDGVIIININQLEKVLLIKDKLRTIKGILGYKEDNCIIFKEIKE